MTSLYSIEHVVPHSGVMCLLDHVVDSDDLSLHASVMLTTSSLFVQQEGMPSWVGIEYMAQAVAAYAGVQARKVGKPVAIGFLVGTRKYVSTRPFFPLNKVVDVCVTLVLRADNGLAVFDCQITVGDELLATASLNVFQPDDVEEFLRNEAQAG